MAEGGSGDRRLASGASFGKERLGMLADNLVVQPITDTATFGEGWSESDAHYFDTEKGPAISFTNNYIFILYPPAIPHLLGQCHSSGFVSLDAFEVHASS